MACGRRCGPRPGRFVTDATRRRRTCLVEETEPAGRPRCCCSCFCGHCRPATAFLERRSSIITSSSAQHSDHWLHTATVTAGSSEFNFTRSLSRPVFVLLSSAPRCTPVNHSQPNHICASCKRLSRVHFYPTHYLSEFFDSTQPYPRPYCVSLLHQCRSDVM